MKVRDIMIKEIITIRPDETLKEVAEKLVERNISGVLVVENKKLVGVISEADILEHIRNTCKQFDMVFIPTPLSTLGIIDFREGKSKNMEEAYKKAGKTQVSEIMKTNLITVKPDEFAKDAAHLMVEKKIHRLPVVEDEKLIGIVTRGDIIKAVTQSDELLKKDVSK